MDVEIRPGDLYHAPLEITDVLTIPDDDRPGMRKSLNVPKDAMFSVIKGHTTRDRFVGWWVVTWNGFSVWTSLPTLISRGHLKLVRRHG